MRLSRTQALFVLIISFVLMFVILQTVRLPDGTHLWREIHNAGHTPIFGIIALIVLGFSRILLKSRLRSRASHYIVAFFVATSLGALSEILQIFEPRDADVWDLVRDIVGITAFLCGFKVIEDYRMGSFDWRNARVLVPLATALLMMIGSISPTLIFIGAYSHRNESFPSIMDFESPLECMFLRLNSAELDRVSPPPGFTAARGEKVGKVTFYPSSYSDFIIEETVGNWETFDYLAFDLYSELDTSIQLAVRIEDRHHNLAYEDRYNAIIDLQPGSRSISIDLREIRTAPDSREMDMTQMYIIQLFTAGVKKPVSVFIDNIRLIRTISP